MKQEFQYSQIIKHVGLKNYGIAYMAQHYWLICNFHLIYPYATSAIIKKAPMNHGSSFLLKPSKFNT